MDIGLTLEYLETKGVPVLGYQTEDLPAFYTRQSGYMTDVKMESPEQVASVLHAKWNLGLRGGELIANPAPEKYSLDFTEMERVINNALLEMKQKNINGKESTPFLLEKVNEPTSGRSLETNIQIILNNAKVAAEIALAFTKNRN